MSQVDDFIVESRKQGLKVLVVQLNPPRIVFTEKDAEMPDAFGAGLAFAANEVANAAKEKPEEVLEALVVHAVARAKEILRKNRRGSN